MPTREGRVELRTTRYERRILAAAAAHERLDVTSFIMRTVLPAAREVVEKAERIGAARLAAPSGRLRRATTIVTDLAAATRAHRFAIRAGPSKPSEHVFRASIGHSRHLRGAERSGGRGQEEVLRHGNRPGVKNI